jgi:hypothetical protein
MTLLKQESNLSIWRIEPAIDRPRMCSDATEVTHPVRGTATVNPVPLLALVLHAWEGGICLTRPCPTFRNDREAGQGSATGAAGALRASLTGAAIGGPGPLSRECRTRIRGRRGRKRFLTPFRRWAAAASLRRWPGSPRSWLTLPVPCIRVALLAEAA